jgi:Zn-dependent protease with chaperone function
VVIVALAVSVGLLFRKKARTAQSDMEAVARRSETDQLRRKLDIVRDKARRLSNVGNLDVLLVPGRDVSAWVARSRHRALIQLTSAFWSLYQGSPELEGAMAHEAGHVVARDVEHFHGLYYLVGIVGGAWTLFVPVALGVLVFLGGSEAALSLLTVAGTMGFSAMAIAGTWSALLVARELQADAFAVNALGDAERVKTFLQRQQELRLKEGARPSPLKAAWRWLIQPDLAWRMSFPVLHGTIGARVELMLGFGVFGVLMVPLWSVLLATGVLENKAAGPTPSQAQLSPAWLVVLAAALALLWIVYQFLWYRNRSAGRDLRLLHSLGTWARLSLPSVALSVLLLLVLNSIRSATAEGGAKLGPVGWLLAVTALPLIWLVLWAAATLAMVWEGRRGATRPGVPHALAALAAVLVAGVVGTTVLFMLVDRDSSSKLGTAGSFVAGFFAAALAMGLWGHRKLNEGRYVDVNSG